MKFMGLSLKRRDSCDYLKDTYGGCLNRLMSGEPDSILQATEFLKQSLLDLKNGKVPMDKLTITKALRSDYKNPDQIAHRVLANRIGKREVPPKPGDRIKYLFILPQQSQNKKMLMGDRIETPQFIAENKLKIDYTHYITNQLMKPLSQLFGLAIVQIWEATNKKKAVIDYNKEIEKMKKEFPDIETFMKQKEKYCSTLIKNLLFQKILTDIQNESNGIKTLDLFITSRKKT
jgi:DNA polymerase elongation subunit (family B)